jgi:predicted transposase YdaD
LLTLKLTPEKAELIYVFIESYLQLTAEENKIYEREMVKLDPELKDDATMEIISSWRKEGRQEGRQEGRHQGKEELLTLLIQQRFSTLPPTITAKLDNLTSEQLNELGMDLSNVNSLAELEDWLSCR